MKKYFSALCAGLAVIGGLSGCSDDEFGNGQNGNVPSAGTIVNFTLSEGVSTRTVYDDDDEYQINWEDGDQIRIYCEEAEDVKQADYTVLKNDTTENEGTLQYNDVGLAWGSEGMHYFYAVYPADDSKVSVSGGIATFQLNQNQTCEFPEEATNGHYMGDPDMTNAYMVAYTSTTPTDKVSLEFNPIMTTLQITLKGRESSAANDEYITVTGLSVIYRASSAAFKYDIKDGTMEEETVETTQTVFVGVKQGDNNYIDLEANDSITFTVFLPPIDIDSNNPITIRPNVAGSSELTVTVNGILGSTSDANFYASSKGKLTLPYWPSEDVTGNNWITPLADEIYVQQLSIPGTHDAAAYETTIFDAGRTQGLDLEKQWNSGIRAFDLRAAWSTVNWELWLWHGITKTEVSLADALDLFDEKLENNPGEFVFLQLRHETESGLFPKPWNNVVAEALSGYDIVEWRPDLTIGECRGKMIVLTRDDYDDRQNVGLVENWPDNSSRTATITYRKNSTDYLVQDYYQYSSGNSSSKISAFTTLMNTTIQFSDPESSYFINKNWALNHISGYQGLIGGTLNYIWNARDVALTIQQSIANLSEPGPLGIIFMDFAGMRQISGWADIGTYTVYCDLLTQTIIDNNYRYTMQRKSE